MKTKLPEKNGSSELLLHLHGSMSSLILLCLENPTEAAHMELGMCPCQKTNWLNCTLNKYVLLPVKRHAF